VLRFSEGLDGTQIVGDADRKLLQSRSNDGVLSFGMPTD
jgi:hypothetical protein